MVRSSQGLVDLQVNGFAGVDFNDEALDAPALDRALEAMLATGVTACLPTIITAHEGELQRRFVALDRAVSESRLGRWMVPGYHLEGPFLNPGSGYAGCHPAEAMIPADPELVSRIERQLGRPILMVTVAPEIKGGIALVRELAAQRRIVALGHTAADFEQVAAAAAAGATLSTHLGNGMPQQVHKLANPIMAQLAEDRLSAGFIADGIHLPPLALKAMLRAKGFQRSILVTDAVLAAAAPAGAYRFAGMDVQRGADGAVRQAGAVSLAGSALCLDAAVRNVVSWELASEDLALAMASAHPLAAIAAALAARSITLPESEVVWDESLRPVRVRIGEIVRRYDLPAAM